MGERIADLPPSTQPQVGRGPGRPLRLALLGLALGFPLGAASGQVDRRAPRASEQRCAGCHPSQVEGWVQSGMARSVDVLRPEELAGLEPVLEAETGFRYRFLADEGRPRIQESWSNPGAREPEATREFPLRFAIGAGRLDRSYVLERSGRMWFAPLEVIGRGPERRAVLGPGHTMRPGTRFDLPIERDCLGCHASGLPPEAYPLNVFPSPEDWRPEGLSCDACHGAVELHAEWQERDLAGDRTSGADPILRHGELERPERLSVCAVCHLQGDARFDLTPTVFGPIGARPEPGGDLLEKRAVFVAAEPSAEVGFVSHVERLVLSRCYTRTDAGPLQLDCTTCHDPHRPLDDPREKARVRNACLDCHGHSERQVSCAREARPSDPDCVSCHMPEVPVFDVEHVRIHDHFVRRRPEPPPAESELRTAEAPDGNWKRFLWPERPLEPADPPDLRMMAWVQGKHWNKAAHLVARAPGPTTRSLPLYHHLRGFLLEELGRAQDARASYEQALALAPGLPATRLNLGLLLAQLGDVHAGLTMLSALAEDHPLCDAAWRHRAAALFERGHPEEVQQNLERAFTLHPQASLASLLADFLESRGKPALAQEWRARAKEHDPRLPSPR